MPSQLVVDYLQRSRAQFQLLHHAPAYTAMDAAHRSNILDSHYAKVVMVRLDHEMAMVIAPAARSIPLAQLGHAVGAEQVGLVGEREFRRCFPRCDPGALPPFGHLFGLRALLLPLFDEGSDIVFNAGSHTEAIRMPYMEFRYLAHADEVELSFFDDLFRTCVPVLQRRALSC